MSNEAPRAMLKPNSCQNAQVVALEFGIYKKYYVCLPQSNEEDKKN